MATAKILSFGIADLLDMDVQERHAWMVPRVWRNLLIVHPVMVGKWSWTMWSEYGIPVGSCGITPDGGAWAFLTPLIRPHMVSATRKTRDALRSHLKEVGPVYADIDKTHPEALRWVKLLGFRHDDGERWVFDEV